MPALGILDRVTDFWMSTSHEAWMLSLNRGDEDDYIPNEVVIHDQVFPYTSCCDAGRTEPFENALIRFPDYIKVATGTLRGWRRRTKGGN